jgi:hypothetical protein
LPETPARPFDISGVIVSCAITGLVMTRGPPVRKASNNIDLADMSITPFKCVVV